MVRLPFHRVFNLFFLLIKLLVLLLEKLTPCFKCGISHMKKPDIFYKRLLFDCYNETISLGVHSKSRAFHMFCIHKKIIVL